MPSMSGALRVPTPGTSWMTLPRYDGWRSDPSGNAAATTRDCRPSAQSMSSWSPESTTMRCGSSRTSVSPAAWRTGRSGGPGSTGVGSGAQDSSGLRSLPSTPALAIFVVLVTTDCSPSAGGSSPPSDPQPLTTVMASAAVIAADDASMPARGPLISTSPTVTSGQLQAGQPASRSIYDGL